jgi:hypothetical protein
VFLAFFVFIGQAASITATTTMIDEQTNRFAFEPLE